MAFSIQYENPDCWGGSRVPTLIIVLASVFGGLWLDNFFNTKPMITVALVLASAPISLVLTFWIATRAIKNINPSKVVPDNQQVDHLTTKGDDDQ